MRYFIDGSSKGLAIGAGVVEVDDLGFMKTYEGNRLHPLSDSTFGELFALEMALDIICKNSDVENIIYVDRSDVQYIFKHKVEKGIVSYFLNPDPMYVDYIAHIRKKVQAVYSLKKSVKIFKLKEESYEYRVYTNSAHALSRSYLNAYADIFLDDNTPLRGRNKLAINHAAREQDDSSDNTPDISVEIAAEMIKEVMEIPSVLNIPVHVAVEQKDEKVHYVSYLMENDVPSAEALVSSKHLVNIFYHSYHNLKRTHKDEEFTVTFTSDVDLVFNIQKSVSYVNCPSDIKNKGLWILDMIETGSFIIQ